MTVDIAEELTKAIQVLKSVNNVNEKDDPSEIEDAFDIISNYVDHIDVANGKYHYLFIPHVLQKKSLKMIRIFYFRFPQDWRT